VKIVAEAHRSEMEGMRAGTPTAAGTPPIPIGSAPHPPTLSAAASLGAPTPPAPASPANSQASAVAAAAAALGGPPCGTTAGSVRAASEAGASVGGGDEEDDFPLDGEEPARKPAIGAPL
jgi:hypothetical protein